MPEWAAVFTCKAFANSSRFGEMPSVGLELKGPVKLGLRFGLQLLLWIYRGCQSWLLYGIQFRVWAVGACGLEGLGWAKGF